MESETKPMHPRKIAKKTAVRPSIHHGGRKRFCRGQGEGSRAGREEKWVDSKGPHDHPSPSIWIRESSKKKERGGLNKKNCRPGKLLSGASRILIGTWRRGIPSDKSRKREEEVSGEEEKGMTGNNLGKFKAESFKRNED